MYFLGFWRVSDTEWVDAFNRKVSIDFWAAGQPNDVTQFCSGVDKTGMSDVDCETDSRNMLAVCELPTINYKQPENTEIGPQ